MSAGLSPSSIGSGPFPVLLDTRVLCSLRYSTRPDPRLVILPRAAAEPLRTRNGSRQPISVRNCCSWIPHAAARVAVYHSASSQKGEMTPCVVEVVSSTDCRSLITTQELLLRSGSFAAQSLSAYTSRYSSSVPAGNDHARCGLRTRYRTTRRARASVPHVARVISRMRFVSGCCTSGLSVARFPNAQTRLRNQDFCSWLTASSPLHCRESFHSRACYTIRSRTVQVTHVDSLFGLSQISRPCEATFVFHPAYRAFEQVHLAVSAWTHNTKTSCLEMVTKLCSELAQPNPEMLPRRSRHRDTSS